MKKHILIFIFLILICSFVYLSTGDYYPNDKAINCLEECLLNDVETEIGLIFYPGGKVEPDAYACLHKLNNHKIKLFIVDFPFNLAFFNKNAADDIIKNNKDINNWYIAGHSLGGVMAYEYAKENDNINGVILMASYPMEDDSDNNLSVLSIYGSNDGLVTKEDREEYISRLPDNSIIEVIEGANHGQFGNYGEQKGDNEAAITSEEQQNLVNDLIVDFIIGE